MTGETNLTKLLASMTPVLAEEEFVFCTVKDAIPPRIEPVCTFREEEGLTLILRRQDAEKTGLSYHYPCHMITLSVHSALEAVGFLAAIASKLAEAGISVNAVSAYFHDHLFVSIERSGEAMTVLKTFQQKHHS